MPETMAFGELLRRSRSETGMSRRSLAKTVGRSTTAIQNIEEGRGAPNIETLVKLGELFRWDYNRVMASLGARVVEDADLRQLVEYAAKLDRPRLLLLAATAREWGRFDWSAVGHVLQVRSRAGKPRTYQTVCTTCGWVGTNGVKGSQADAELIAHRDAAIMPKKAVR